MTRILVIDPESSGVDLIEELEKRLVAVEVWQQTIPFVLSSTTDSIRPERDLVQYVDENNFDFIIAGGEGGVSASEWLSARKGLPCSDPTLIHHRRDKNSMVVRAASLGVPTAKSFFIQDPSEIPTLFSQLQLPVMVKPSNSAGSDLCRAASSWAQAIEFVDEVLLSTSIMGNRNSGAVVQEFIVGPQFHVNTVVVDGVHEVTEVYSNLFRTVDGVPQLFAGRTYSRHEPEYGELVTYARDVLHALGVSCGATHTEIRLTADGPRLIEFNGRLMGPTQPSNYFLSAQGYSQATIYADELAGYPERAHRAIEARPDSAFLGFYLLTAPVSGVVTRFDTSRLERLKSYRGVFKSPCVGAAIDTANRTTDADLGIAFFASSSALHLESDIREAERLEHAGLIHKIGDA